MCQKKHATDLLHEMLTKLTGILKNEIHGQHLFLVVH